ncbi:hypothetical protein BST28_17545 [Mycolicibacter kumamotonensis]|uniref:Uncharacterized protein n=1 Tax=Mycolicibacter kumamotonensis TaxID=354243 RepID=A0A1X0DZ29_9MYCO|nr:hypothetical protein BST28_17545 [Mycolicibacter kumamotonensis]
MSEGELDGGLFIGCASVGTPSPRLPEPSSPPVGALNGFEGSYVGLPGMFGAVGGVSPFIFAAVSVDAASCFARAASRCWRVSSASVWAAFAAVLLAEVGVALARISSTFALFSFASTTLGFGALSRSPSAVPCVDVIVPMLLR